MFISGIPGIGKSELAKSYAKQHKADYTNIVHLYYAGSLRKDITCMAFVDDLPDDTAGARYERHARFLRTLKEDTLLLASNIHANLGGMYRESGNYIKAKEHMEAAFTLLRQYDLLACHDSIPQVVNYAMLLSEMRQPDKAIAVLEQVEEVVQEHNSAVCMDTAGIYEAIGNTFLMTGNVEQAAIQHRKCFTIYAELFPDQPDMLSAKQADLRMLYEQVGAIMTPSTTRIA